MKNLVALAQSQRLGTFMTHQNGRPVRLMVTCWLVVATAALLPATLAFQTSPLSRGASSLTTETSRQKHKSFVGSRRGFDMRTKHFIFRRNSEDDEDDKSDAAKSETSEKEQGGIPFFSRFLRKDDQQQVETTTTKEEDNSNNDNSQPRPVATTAVLEKRPYSPPPSPSPSPAQKLEDLSPVEQAKILRAQAEKARLEAERMDAQLTLQKITRLERELAHAKKITLTNNITAKTEVESLMRELDVLRAKMRGETVAPKAATTSTSDASSVKEKRGSTQVLTSTSTIASAAKGADTPRGDYLSRMPEFEEAFDEKVFQGVLDEINNSPDFMRRAMAAQVGVTYDDLESLNATEVALRLDKMSRFDFSFGEYERPSFSQSDIDEMKGSLKQSDWINGLNVDPRLKKLSAGNETEWALLALEYQYFMQKYAVGEEQLTDFVKEDEIFGELMSQLNVSAVDSTIDSFYPKCTRKEGQEPTEAQVQQLVTAVLPKAKFTTTAKPEKVAGGFVIRGTSRYDTGDQLIEAIDKYMEKTSLGDKMTVLFTKDFTVFASDFEGNEGALPVLSEIDPVLYITGADIVREPRRAWLSLTSGLGLATCWYLSIYPFLLNPTIASRVDEELALVDAGLTPDLSWLTDLSVPLFATYITIMACHELGHRLTAVFNGIKPTLPTFVPSIITGVTTTVTSFKEPPKNQQSMFDFSVAGPLSGMIASLVAVLLGAQLTVSADPSSLPALPLEILRQSSLGGGLVDAVLGNGALSVPDGALGSRAVATMTIPLHPVAVAGYIGLIVNALNVLPIGTTDGGRMAQTLFGRGAKLIIGNLFLLATLVVGIGGSDLFLFYFAFCIAFQTGNEIPARNEVDDVDVSRIFVAIAAYLLALLSLIPLQ